MNDTGLGLVHKRALTVTVPIQKMFNRSVSSPDLQQAMEDLDNVLLSDDSTSMASLTNALQLLSASIQQIVPRLEYLQTTNDILMERTSVLLARTAPKSNCTLCAVEENRDSHFSGRCQKYADPVSRTIQASKLNLCLRCLKPSHGDDCMVTCGGCGLGHNQLLCHKGRPAMSKRPRHH
ncbi:hypothetical protein GCK32_018833 [Trichostrongylus colubriformis]|uniref:Uncharacterized protein n=1 Tax=Trichostrongylus colubriformis TaxID=6319 RepID=A0AAN8FKM9_TRICO